jgi:ubiquinone/menaquinone biosynthesis C-methylase UbiE
MPLVPLALVISACVVAAAQRKPEIIRQEIAQATREAPKLAEVLRLEPGMTVADIGAGGGAMSASMAKWLGPTGRVYATDIGSAQLAEIREMVTREALSTVTVVEGAVQSTNLPDGCCDAIFLRDVYHHLTSASEFNTSVRAALKPGGRLAIIDFEPMPGSKVPAGVPENRGGHGVPPSVVISEVSASGFQHVTTIPVWPTENDHFFLVLFRKL